ncbi:hypothetical protein DICVIV_08331 [Dictyocaulus viviparus]|uniref:Uncharacterized protein n=1 Tax=Dictyocaulus viviparus TaxID=29172 RepID=A0A0D8XM50_DICVI|nr:hypothetical protein DICVIV_08331 [Dictyocaulus viviparus]
MNVEIFKSLEDESINSHLERNSYRSLLPTRDTMAIFDNFTELLNDMKDMVDITKSSAESIESRESSKQSEVENIPQNSVLNSSDNFEWIMITSQPTLLPLDAPSGRDYHAVNRQFVKNITKLPTDADWPRNSTETSSTSSLLSLKSNTTIETATLLSSTTFEPLVKSTSTIQTTNSTAFLFDKGSLVENPNRSLQVNSTFTPTFDDSQSFSNVSSTSVATEDLMSTIFVGVKSTTTQVDDNTTLDNEDELVGTFTSEPISTSSSKTNSTLKSQNTSSLPSTEVLDTLFTSSLEFERDDHHHVSLSSTALNDAHLELVKSKENETFKVDDPKQISLLFTKQKVAAKPKILRIMNRLPSTSNRHKSADVTVESPSISTTHNSSIDRSAFNEPQSFTDRNMKTIEVKTNTAAISNKAMKTHPKWTDLSQIDFAKNSSVRLWRTAALNHLKKAEVGNIATTGVFRRIKIPQKINTRLGTRSFISSAKIKRRRYTLLPLAKAFAIGQSTYTTIVPIKSTAYKNSPPILTEKESIQSQDSALSSLVSPVWLPMVYGISQKKSLYGRTGKKKKKKSGTDYFLLLND